MGWSSVRGGAGTLPSMGGRLIFTEERKEEGAETPLDSMYLDIMCV